MIGWPSCFYCDRVFETHEARCAHMRGCICGWGADATRRPSGSAPADPPTAAGVQRRAFAAQKGAAAAD